MSNTVLDTLGKFSATNYLVIVLHDLADISEQPLKDLLLLMRDYHKHIGILNQSGEKLRFLVVGSDRLWNLCCHKPSDTESPFNIAKRLFIGGLSYQEVQSKFKDLEIKQTTVLRDLTDGVPSLLELIEKESEDFEDLSSCFDPLEDRWNSLSLSAQQILKSLAVDLDQEFPDCKLDNQCPQIAKFDDSTIWQEIFWKGFVKLRYRKLAWRSPVHQAFAMTQAQVADTITKSALLEKSLLKRVESLEETLKGQLNARLLTECTEELVSLSVHSGNAELVPLLERLLETNHRETILMELKNVAAKSQKQWIKDLSMLTTVPPTSFKKLVIESITVKVASDINGTDNNAMIRPVNNDPKIQHPNTDWNRITNDRNQSIIRYQDFEILVTQDRKIRTSSSQHGNAEGKLQLNMKKIEPVLKQIEMEQTDTNLLKELGRQLYNGLFPTAIRTQLYAAIAVAQVDGAGIRLRLAFEPSELAVLPWEFLYDEISNSFLANNTETTLSRHVDVFTTKRAPLSRPLRVLLAISSPTDLPQLDFAKEKQLIFTALAEHRQSGKVELDVLPEATFEEIRDALDKKSYNIFHFIGHGFIKNNKEFIALVDTDSKKCKLLDGEEFANFFLGTHNIGLAVLNSCLGAPVSSQQVFAGIAPNLVRRGIPAVVAMQYPILDTTATLFAGEFYRVLALGLPIDAAIQKTRNTISMKVGLGKRDFATPVLYTTAGNRINLGER